MKMQAGLKCAVLMACLVSAVYGGNCPSGAQAAVCPDCVAGQYAGVADAADVAADCITCDAGKYSETAGETTDNCINCVEGKYSTVAGLELESKCINCVAGKYSETAGMNADNCINCVAGKWSDVAALDAEGDCKDCVAGKYFETDFQITDVCINCVAGKWSDVAALDAEGDCKDCVAGKYFTQDYQITDVCISCDAGKYFETAAQAIDVCITCPAGKSVVATGSDEIADCTNCPAGTYGSHTYSTGTDTACISCVGGQYITDIPPLNDEIADCTQCITDTFAADTMTASCLTGAYNTGSDIPAVNNDAAVTFTTRGDIEAGGKIELIFNQGQAYDVTATPAVTFTPADNAATVTWSSGTSTVLITLGAQIDADTAVAVSVDGIRNPASVTQADGTVTISSYDSSNTIVDAGILVTDTYVAGVLTAGLQLFSYGTTTPGTTDDVVVKFTSSGQLVTGATIKLVIADAAAEGVYLADSTPDVSFAVPAIGATASWDGTNEIIVTLSGTIPEGTAAEFTIPNVRTPRGASAADSTVAVTSYEAGNQNDNEIVDGPTDMVSQQISTGANVGQFPTFAYAADTAGTTSIVTVSFTNNGRIEAGGNIVLVMASTQEIDSAPPTVAFTAPSAFTSSAVTWDGGSLTLSIVVDSEIPEDSSVIFTIDSVRSSQDTTAAAEVSVVTYTVDGTTAADEIDTGNLATDVIVKGALTVGDLATATDKPGYKDTATVTFTNNGKIASAGSIKIVFSDGQEMPASPVVTFATPFAATQTADFSATELIITLDQDIAEDQAISFTIDDFRTQKDMQVATASVAITTYSVVGTDNADIIDGPDTFTSDTIAQGTLVAATFDTATDAPGRTSDVTFTFTTEGRLLTGSTIQLRLPDVEKTCTTSAGITNCVSHQMYGWRMGENPTTSLDVTGVGATATFESNTRYLDIVITGTIAQNVQVIATISDVLTPSAIYPSKTFNLYTFSADGTNTANGIAYADDVVTTDDLIRGSLTSLTWDSAIDEPGQTSTVTVSLTTEGFLQSGMKILIELPNHSSDSDGVNHQSGWRMDSSPTIEFSTPAAATSSNFWSPSSRELTVTMTSDIPEGTAVVFEISDVKTPSSIHKAETTGTVMTYDPTFASSQLGKIIDGTQNIATDELTAGSLYGDLTFDTEFDTPGVTGTATVKFTVEGELQNGAYIILTMPQISVEDGLAADSSFPKYGFRFKEAGVAQAKYSLEETLPFVVSGVVASRISSPMSVSVFSTTFKADRTVEIIVGDPAATPNTPIPEGTEVTLLMLNVQTPSSILAAQKIKINTYDSQSILIDGEQELDTDEIERGSVTGFGGVANPEATTAIQSPGRYTDILVKFRTTGELRAGSVIKIAFTDADRVYDFGGTGSKTATIEASCGSFTYSLGTGDCVGTLSLSAEWDATTGVMLMTTVGSDINEFGNVIISFAGIWTPPNEESAASLGGTFSTFDPQGTDGASYETDGTPITFVTPAYVKSTAHTQFGMFGETGTKHSSPGRTDKIVVTMDNKGRMVEGATIKLHLTEAHAYTMETTDLAAIVMTECGNFGKTSPCPTLAGTWSTTTHVLDLVVTGGTVGEQGKIQFSFTATNPPNAVVTQWGEVSKYSQVGTDDASHCIDGWCGSGPTQLLIGAIIEGPLTAATFVHASNTANQVALLTLKFTTASPLVTGRLIRFDLSDAASSAWSMAASPTITATTGPGCSTASWDSTTRFLDCITDADTLEGIVVELVVTDVTTPTEQGNSHTLSIRTYVAAQADHTHDFETATGPVSSLQGLYSDSEGVLILNYNGPERGWDSGGWDSSGGSLGTQPVTYAATSNTNPNSGGDNLFRSDWDGTSQTGNAAVGEYRTQIFDLGVGDITAEFAGTGTVSIGLFLYRHGRQSMGTEVAVKTVTPTSSDPALTQLTWSASSLSAFVGKTVFLKIIDADTAGYIAVDNLKYPALWKIDGGVANIAAVPAGRLLSYPRWDTAIDKPDTDTSVTITFRTNGGVPSGGSINMALPIEYGAGTWGTLATSFTTPTASGTVSKMELSTGQNWKVELSTGIAEDTLVSLKIDGVHTGSISIAASQGDIWTAAADGGRIDFRTLFIDRLDFGRSHLMSGAQYGAYCPNSCSRHGTCRNFGRCTCYSRPASDDPAWTENDCSLRTCPKGNAWTDLASGNSQAHGRAECSMAGNCDRKTGNCECFEGYEGIACERSLCPNNCNGRGRCVTQEILAYEASKTYSEPWDAQKEVGCVCDIGARGPDCSLEECPTGIDPRGGAYGQGNNFGRDCSGRGICDYATGLCHCFSGMYGSKCDQKAEFG